MPEKPEKYQSFQQWKADQTDIVEQRLSSVFNAIPQGCNFRSDLPGVDRVTIIRPVQKGVRSIHTILFFRGNDGKEKHETLQLLDDGKLFGKLPKALQHLSHKTIAAEILRNLEQIKPEFWSEIKTPVLPEGQGVPLGPRQGRVDIAPEERILADPKRIEHIRKKGARFGGLEKTGLSGYHVFVFDGFMVLENERFDNAAYVVAIPDDVSIPEVDAPKDERDAFFELPKIVALLSQSKQELIADKEHTIRIVHRGEWVKKLDSIIEERLAARRKVAV